MKPNEPTPNETVKVDTPSLVESEAESNHFDSTRFEILETLGSGGMGTVYKARDPALDRIVAIKVLSTPSNVSQESLVRFQQEAKAAGRLNHKSIVGIHEFALSGESRPFIVMDFVEGVSLADLIEREKSLPVERCLSIAILAADALAYSHDHNVIHRDLKPANIMLTEGEDKEASVRIVDFGIAKIATEQGKSLTETGEIFGSPLYMSPEQCMGEKVDQRTDIYSLGCVLYESLVGRPPHRGETSLSTALMHLNDEPAPLASLRADLKGISALQVVMEKALAKDPAERYQNMQEFKTDLEKLLEGSSEELIAVKSGLSKQRIVKAIKQRLGILLGIIALVGASLTNNLTISGLLYLLGGLFLVFSIPGLRGDGPVYEALKNQKKTSMPITKTELIIWILLLPLLGALWFFFPR